MVGKQYPHNLVIKLYNPKLALSYFLYYQLSTITFWKLRPKTRNYHFTFFRGIIKEQCNPIIFTPCRFTMKK